MIALLWREFRERRIGFFIMILIAWLVILGPEMAGLLGQWTAVEFLKKGRHFYSDPGEFRLLSRFFIGSLTLTGYVMALILSYQQVHTDRANRVEQFLLHLPLARWRIMFVKWFTGFSAMLIAFLPPFIILVFWTAWPTHRIGPFRWEMAIPGLLVIAVAVIAHSVCLWAWIGPRKEKFLAVAAVLQEFFLLNGVILTGISPNYPEVLLLLPLLLILNIFGAMSAYERREP